MVNYSSPVTKTVNISDAFGLSVFDAIVFTALLLQKDAIIAELKSKVAEAMALVPSAGFNSFCSAPSSVFSSSVNDCPSIQSISLNVNLAAVSQSSLNPHATDYQPRLSPH
jgi:hypothetical protein